MLITIKSYALKLSEIEIISGLLVIVLDYNSKVREFEVHLCQYVNFSTNIIGKCMNPNTPPHWAIVWIPDMLYFSKNGFRIRYPAMVDLPLNETNKLEDKTANHNRF